MLCPPGLVCCTNFMSYKVLGVPSDYDQPYIPTPTEANSKFTIEKTTKDILEDSYESAPVVVKCSDSVYNPFDNPADFVPNTDKPAWSTLEYRESSESYDRPSSDPNDIYTDS